MPGFVVGDATIFKVELAVPPEGRETLVGVKEAERLVDEEEAVKLTVVVGNPLRLVSVIVEFAEAPGCIVTGFGLAPIEKPPVDRVHVVEPMIQLSLNDPVVGINLAEMPVLQTVNLV